MSTAQESSPSQNETDQLKTDDTLKPETETTSKNSPTNKPKIDEATVVSDDPGSDLKSNSISQAEIQTNNAKKEENAKALKKDTSPTDPQLQVLEKPPSEDQNTSKHTSPTKNGSTEINKQEVDGTKAVQEDSAAVAEITPADSQVQPVKNESTSKDSSPAGQSIATHGPETDGGKGLAEELPNKVEPHPPVQEISPADDEATPKELSPSKPTSPTKNGSMATNKQEVDGTKTVQEDSAAVAEITPADSQVQPVKNESTSKDSSPAGQSIATHGLEADGGKSLGEELPNKVEPHPPVQEISPADDEATPKELPPPKNDSSPPKEDSTNLAEPCPKKSLWKKIMDLFRLRKGKVSKSKSKSSPSSQKQDDKKVQISSLIQADIDYIAKKIEELEHYNKDLDETLKSARDDFKALQEQGKSEELQDLRKDMIKLKVQDPSKYKFDGDEKDRLKNLTFRSKAKKAISKEMLNKMPHLHKTDDFETSLDFKDFEARYSELDDQLKLCLLCFSALPGYIIRKRLMLQWWVSEGFVSEEEADGYFTQLIEKGFIEPVNDNRSLSVGRCQMHPFYRSALVILAERAKFFNFGAKGEPTQNFSGSFQSCLMGEGLISFDDLKNEKLKTEDLEKLHLLINVDEHILEFRPDWFSRMTNLNFLHLGQWKVLATDHIEVEDTEFLSGLEKMSCVKFLSLQGISNIISLPKSILLMENLEILDIRACYNLETIPEGIEFLKNLIHLDMSECYLLDHMPKGLSLLNKLKVIKGFVVGTDDEKNKPCTLEDLEKLPNLSKLCIYTDLVEFPKEPHVKALEKLKELCKLTITWGGNALRATTLDQPDSEHKKDSSTAENIKKKKQEPPGSSKSPNGLGQTGKLPPKLEKLDLKCFPKSTTPYWLELRNLKGLNLKKLYIRGGKLSDLGQYQDFDDCNIVPPVAKETWKVEVLRLKYLSEIKMEWRQLHELFPRLVYLEQVSCQNLTLFPCDANGVWINKEK